MKLLSGNFLFCVVLFGQCGAGLAPPGGQAVGSAGGRSGFPVLASTPNCSWTAVSDADWLQIIAGATGTGPGAVGYLSTPNNSPTGRRGTITVRGNDGSIAIRQVVQSGLGCRTSFSPARLDAAATGGTLTLQVVSSPENCFAWAPGSDVEWAHPASMEPVLGSGRAEIQVDANLWRSPRRAVLRFGTSQADVVQAAGSGCAPLQVTKGTALPGGFGPSSCASQWHPANGPAAQFSFPAQAGERVSVDIFTYSPLSVTLAGPDGRLIASRNYLSMAGAMPLTDVLRIPWEGGFQALPQSGAYTVEISSFGVPMPGGGVVLVSPACDVTLSANAVRVGAGGGSGTIQVSNPTGCDWAVGTYSPTWLAFGPVQGGAATFQAQPGSGSRYGTLMIGGQLFTVFQSSAQLSITFSPPSASMPAAGGTGRVIASTQPPITGMIVVSTQRWLTLSGPSMPEPGWAYTVAPNPEPRERTASILGFDRDFTVTQAAGGGIEPSWFVPLPPCRVTDTRESGGYLAGGASRGVQIRESRCGVPPGARAYSLNVTAVPRGRLDYLTIWPAGQPMPVVSTLNAFDGRVTANAAIVPAGSNGAVSVFATNDTDFIIDINGYFATPAAGAFPFSVQVPCRVVDTRAGQGTPDAFGPPRLFAGTPRTFPLGQGLDSCLWPPARAYSLNATAVPAGPLGYLTLWPAGQAQPWVSTLNSLEGKVRANAAIVPAGNQGGLEAFATGDTDLVLDLNGFFAPQMGGPASFSFYPLTPCRVADTRNPAGAFGGPMIAGGGTRTFPVPQGACGAPSSAAAYSLNITAVPAGPLGYLTAWPAGVQQPVASTLNSFDGQVTANAAIVPAGASGAINIFASNPTHVIIDINGYFGP